MSSSSSAAPISIPAFSQSQQRLLLAEHEAEIAASPLNVASSTSAVSSSTRRALQVSGHALTGIVLVNCKTGMGGLEVGEFGADSAVPGSRDEDGDGRIRLGSHGMRSGDVVRIEEIAAGGRGKKEGEDSGKDKSDRNGLEGVVTRVGDRSVWVAVGERGQRSEESVEELWGKKLWM